MTERSSRTARGDSWACPRGSAAERWCKGLRARPAEAAPRVVARAQPSPHHCPVRLKWDASPWLLAPVPLLAAPATVLWGAALFGTVGLGPAPFDPNALMR